MRTRSGSGVALHALVHVRERHVHRVNELHKRSLLFFTQIFKIILLIIILIEHKQSPNYVLRSVIFFR